MRHLVIGMLAVLTACGGSPFTEVLLEPDSGNIGSGGGVVRPPDSAPVEAGSLDAGGGDVQVDAKAEAGFDVSNLPDVLDSAADTATVDVQPVPDVQQPDVQQPDVQQPPVDTGPTCTPLNRTWSCAYAGHVINGIKAPVSFCLYDINGLSANGYTTFDCQCAETYNCACVGNHNPCNSGEHITKCVDTTDGPIVSCFK